MCKLTWSLKNKRQEDKHRRAELFQCNFKTGVKDIDFIFTASSLTFRIYGKIQGSDIGNGRSEVPYNFFCCNDSDKMWFISCFSVSRQVVLLQLHLQNDSVLIIMHISAQSVNWLHFFFIIIYKQQKQRSVIVFVSLSLFCTLLWLSFLFWAQSVFFSLFALPSYATCRCWDYCCAYLVRCWILCMTLSCVPTVKRLIKHLCLPQIQYLWALFLPLSHCARVCECKDKAVACVFGFSGTFNSHRCRPIKEVKLQSLRLSGHPGMEERILRSSERNCLVTKV